ncbi:MAG: EAL domain-containing protein [Thiobacillus sp.]|uniref:putative bifunctional diguanylate cyclase/phosphodiesterase n=1 Tax=Thiobacillus sp. TaxID=924 RepID=UPI002733ECDD|nr:EAL domain-containing protein [Thiobacillus sp.]MDP3584547.1 EAL domain-containing protein [Thiobacillus sp.]
MNQGSQHLGMGARIGIGFILVLILMVALGATGLRYVAEANERLKNIAQNNNVKTELATQMHSALRERALSMHTLPILGDAFEKDLEIQHFNSQGIVYIEARERLGRMPLSPEEARILKYIRELTVEAHPKVQKVVEMSMFTDDQAKIFELIRSVAMPRQRAIADQVSALLDLQRQQTAAAVRAAENSYVGVRNLMLGLGSSALLIGIAIAGYVSRRVAGQALQLANQAMYDPLTGLANRSLLHDRIEREIERSRRSGVSFGVALMDLDRFKEVNDTLGHNVGDELLREVGRRLKHTIRAEDTVARLGGDEYVVVIHGLEPEGVPVIAEKVLAALDDPFHWQNQSIDLGASLGISLYPSQCADASGLIRCADIAMYVAKRSGKGYAVYAPDQVHTNRSDLSLKSELREAILSNQLCLYYQPQINHRSQRVVGLEALIRWHHPQRGFLGPDSFIPLAEEAGLIGPLTQWVLKTALKQLAVLRREGHALTMAVNLSARNLHDMSLPGSVEALLAECGVPPEHLTLEITESAVMSNPSDGLTILTALDRMGVTLSIDDFGTGYSSLAYLKRLPVDELKIDKSFVMDMEANDNDAVIVRSTIDLAHNLGLKVVAEGVESRDAWDTLSILGCDTSQGFFMGRPMPVDKLQTWLRDSTLSPILAGAIYAL